MEAEELDHKQNQEVKKPEGTPFEELTDVQQLKLLIRTNLENTDTSKGLAKQLVELNQNFNNIAVTKDTLDYGIDREIQEFVKAYNKYQELKDAFPTEINAELSDQSKAALSLFESKLKWLKTPVFLQYGLAFLSAITLTLTLILSVKFYRESIRTKSEIRAEILQELKEENKEIVDKQDYKQLQLNDKIVKSWAKLNPQDSKSLLKFTKGYEEATK